MNLGLHECLGCGMFTQPDDIGLCEECAAKMDRDMIRNKDWAYSSAAFALSNAKREDLRRAIIKKYGKSLELISPDDKKNPGKGAGRSNENGSTGE